MVRVIPNFVGNRAAQVYCGTCGGGVERVEWSAALLTLTAFCHGEKEVVDVLELQDARGIHEIMVFVPETSESDGGVMTHDGVGGASVSGACSCGTPGCRVDARQQGCPRYSGS